MARLKGEMLGISMRLTEGFSLNYKTGFKRFLNKRLRSLDYLSEQCGRFIQPMMKQGWRT